MWVSAASGLGAPQLTPQASSAFNAATNQLSIGSYDAAGNQTALSNFTAICDAENRQTQVTDSTSGNQMTYRYDGNGQRVIKGNTVYVYDAFGALIAQYNNFPVSSVTCTTCYLSVDHLGSTRLVTDSDANVVARHDHMPFGEELSSGVSGRTSQWDGQDGVSQKFTGQERDTETGLDFFQARYYSSAIGRFMSPDPANAGADPSNPQSWNGYSYVLNSPMVGVDPSGACSQGVDGSYYDDDNEGPENGGSFLYTGDCQRQDGSLVSPSAGGSTTVSAQGPSDVEYWWTILTIDIPQGVSPQQSANNGTRADWLNAIYSVFGYDQRIKLPSCAALAFSTAADDLNPFSPGTFGAIKDGVESALTTGRLYYFNAAISHAAGRTLTFPNKSSIFRGLLKNSGNLGKAAGDYLGPVAVDAGLLHGFILEMIAMQHGECQ